MLNCSTRREKEKTLSGKRVKESLFPNDEIWNNEDLGIERS